MGDGTNWSLADSTIVETIESTWATGTMVPLDDSQHPDLYRPGGENQPQGPHPDRQERCRLAPR